MAISARSLLPRSCSAPDRVLRSGRRPPAAGTRGAGAPARPRRARSHPARPSRRYSGAPLTSAELLALVAATDAADAAMWPGERAAGLGLELLVMPRAVAGLAANRLQRVALDGAAGRLDPISKPVDDLSDAVLQLEWPRLRRS